MTSPTRHTLAVPSFFGGQPFSVEVPAYGSRIIGPLCAWRDAAGVTWEIRASNEHDLRMLVFDVSDLLNGGGPIGAFVPILARLGRELDAQGQPLARDDWLIAWWERAKATAAGPVNKSALVRELLEVMRRERPWELPAFGGTEAGLTSRLQRRGVY